MNDMNGKPLESGHIVAVRYAWSSYVGVIRGPQLSLFEGANRWKGFARYHALEPGKTYQVLGHVDPKHPDYDYNIWFWWHSEEGECPVKIDVYRDYQKEVDQFMQNRKK